MPKPLSEMTLEELWELFPIILKEHNPAYREWYLEEQLKLQACLHSEDIVRMNHIGSTAVKNLIAKPTVDILLEVHEVCSILNLKQTLANNGWILMSEHTEPALKLAFNKGYTPNGFADKVFHLHVRNAGDWDELYFRDYLMVHPEIAAEYGELKLRLLEKYEHDRDGYTAAKTVFVQKYSKLAREEFTGRYKPVKIK